MYFFFFFFFFQRKQDLVFHMDILPDNSYEYQALFSLEKKCEYMSYLCMSYLCIYDSQEISSHIFRKKNENVVCNKFKD